MVKHKQNIIINCNVEKTWAFLIELSRSLIFDNFFIVINLPNQYSINKQYTFNVDAKYFFTEYQLKAEIVDILVPAILNIEFKNNFILQNKIFTLDIIDEQTKLTYELKGDFGSLFKNSIISPIIKLSCLNELRYIKKAIESSEIHTDNKEINTVSTYK